MGKVKAKQIQSISDLTPDAANVNKGSERGNYMIDWSITNLGAGRSILADRSGNVIAGNKTLEAAAEHGLPVRVVETDGSELVVVQRTDLDLSGKGKERERARQLAIADNRASEVGYSADVEILLSHAQSGVDISAMYRKDEIETLLAGLTPEEEGKPGGGGDDFDATPEETQTRVQYGDLWECGAHRVLCGDSTKAEDVARVMGGEKADMVFTDPPYGVAYGSGKKGAISGDLSQVAIPLSFKTAIDIATLDDARLYYCGGSTNCPMYFSLFDSYCQQMPHLIIWVKESFVMRPNNYHSQFEVIYFGWKGKGGSSEYWFEDRKASDIWQISRDKTGDYLHPTQKPVDIPMKAIGYSAPPNGIVFEPFGGSGSTLIASERTNRKCRSLELTPKYVNVILSRWEVETGKEAKLLERLNG